MAQINAVNVVYDGDDGFKIASFTNDDQGIADAEAMFKRLVIEDLELAEDTITDDEMDDVIMDGVYDKYSKIMIVHS